MDFAISSGVVNLRHKILGRKLRPYSAAHAFALQAGGWDAESIASILGFLRVCSRPIGPDCIPKGFPEIPPTIGDVFRALWLMRRKNLDATLNQIAEYLKDHNTAPSLVWPSTPESTPQPFNGSSIMAEVVLGVKSGLSEHRAWSMPFGWLRTWTAHYELLDINPHKPRPDLHTESEESDFEKWDREHNPQFYAEKEA